MLRELSLKTKIILLRYLQTHTERATAKIFKVSKTTVHNIKTRKAEYISRYRTGNRMYRRKCIRTKNLKINLAVLRWYRRVTKKNIVVTGAMLQRRALKCAKKCGITTFMGSNGWLECFKKRYLMKNKKSVNAKVKKSKVAAVAKVPADIHDTVAEEDVSERNHSVKIEAIDTEQDNTNDTVADTPVNNTTNDYIPVLYAQKIEPEQSVDLNNIKIEAQELVEVSWEDVMMWDLLEAEVSEEGVDGRQDENHTVKEESSDTVQDNMNVSVPDIPLNNFTASLTTDYEEPYINYLLPCPEIDSLLNGHENEQGQLIDLDDIKIESWNDIIMPDMRDFLKTQPPDDNENNNESVVEQNQNEGQLIDLDDIKIESWDDIIMPDMRDFLKTQPPDDNENNNESVVEQDQNEGQLIDLDDIKIESWDDIIMPDMRDFLKTEPPDDNENNNESVVEQDQNEGQLIDLDDIKIESWDDIIMPDMRDFLKTEPPDDAKNNNDSNVEQQNQNEENSYNLL